jgi:hypothetical protein
MPAKPVQRVQSAQKDVIKVFEALLFCKGFKQMRLSLRRTILYCKTLSRMGVPTGKHTKAQTCRSVHAENFVSHIEGKEKETEGV